MSALLSRLGLGPVERTALRVLRRRVGLWTTARIGISIRGAERRREPFAALPPADSDDETGSREQAGPAVLLYRALREVRHEAEALSVTAEVVEASALVFLSQTLGPLRRAELETLDDEGRRQFVADRQGRFPNATVEWNEVSSERVQFTVTACRLVQLVGIAGHPELAPLFCTGDARFFGTVEPDVLLDRPHTIAGGADTCPFTLTWRTD